MNTDQKLDEVISKLDNLQRQVDLMQSVLLELTKSAGKTVGRQGSGSVSPDPVAGCEDQCKEPQG